MVYLFKIRELCEKKGVSMKQAASDLGMTEQSLHKLIKANSTKIDTLLTIADYFKVEPAYFFDSHSGDTNQYVRIKKEEFSGLIKKVLAYSIHGFGLIKLEWNNNEQKFNTYFDILDKQYVPTGEDLEYISAILERKIELTNNTNPKDISKLLMTKDEFDFTSAYYYSIKKGQAQEELQKLSSFMDKHNIPVTESIKRDIRELNDKIKHYESKSIIGTNK
ncbi:helix-turn-helix transcriptional regulator [Dysgonomonas mossii]|uniref:XRE family transcriptional regulator n=1 Tax=Dysgonomonas mossii TaxID=163665 RepID=A0A4Y9II60_9BACT|nr:helix-turn-helix transcriptional regulator [Dysgonomonas mossii]MBF0762721.1 helix-turn-helix transcriptional regulator [Dysgonomonas mossii]TFU86851.1 XRE family transcriptional regulator [Dysgonomonas mossii]